VGISDSLIGDWDAKIKSIDSFQRLAEFEIEGTLTGWKTIRSVLRRLGRALPPMEWGILHLAISVTGKPSANTAHGLQNPTIPIAKCGNTAWSSIDPVIGLGLTEQIETFALPPDGQLLACHTAPQWVRHFENPP
jgi:hypothetical protein